MTESRLSITQYDEADKVTATFVQSVSAAKDGTSRIDKIEPMVTKSWYSSWVLDVFLPAGYPQSVTEDYTEYQIYDSLQAFVSSIVGLISSRAILASVGVGDATASAMAAVAYEVLQETAGRLGTIVFAHRFGTSLEPECKMYRLLADILNDVGFVLDCLSPLLPKPARVVMLSFSGVLRALCGVAAGSAKASLSAHFAKHGNLGELNAKDSSQETVVSLAGMLIGLAVVPFINGLFETWATVMALLAIHLEMNRRAVRAVKMKSLNRQRATLVYFELQRKHVPTPAEISQVERIFELDGVLRKADGVATAHYCTVGDSMEKFLASLTVLHKATHSAKVQEDLVQQILKLFQDKAYLIWYSKREPFGFRFHIIIKKNAKARDVLQAWWQALELSQCDGDEHDAMVSATWPASCSPEDLEKVFEAFRRSGKNSERLLQTYEERLTSVGWNLESEAMETNARTRISIERG